MIQQVIIYLTSTVIPSGSSLISFSWTKKTVVCESIKTYWGHLLVNIRVFLFFLPLTCRVVEVTGPGKKPRPPSPQEDFPARSEGPRSIPRPERKHNPSIESCVFPEASYQWDVP